MSLNQDSLKDRLQPKTLKIRAPKIAVSSRPSKRVPHDKSLSSFRKQFGKGHAVVYFSELKVKGKKVADVDLHYHGEKKKPFVTRITYSSSITPSGKRETFETSGMISWTLGLLSINSAKAMVREYVDTRARLGAL